MGVEARETRERGEFVHLILGNERGAPLNFYNSFRILKLSCVMADSVIGSKEVFRTLPTRRVTGHVAAVAAFRTDVRCVQHEYCDLSHRCCLPTLACKLSEPWRSAAFQCIVPSVCCRCSPLF